MINQEITLAYDEVLVGAQIGAMRQVENIKFGQPNKRGYRENNNWQLHIDGALAEMALAKHLGLYYSKGWIRAGDVGEFEVRSSKLSHARLIVHKDDKPDSWYWLLTGTENKWTVHGGMLAKDAMQEKYWDDPTKGRPAYFVPQSDLRWPNNEGA